MGKESRKHRRRRASVNDQLAAVSSADESDGAAVSSDQLTSGSSELTPQQVELLVENDPTLVPTGPSVLQVDDAVLEPAEIDALLRGLASQLEEAATAAGVTATDQAAGMPTSADQSTSGSYREGASRESDPSPARRSGGYSKLSPLAWLFADHAGVGRPARDKQGHHLRARRRFGKKAGAAPRQAQGSLFGDHL
jgi:hypothetical protein